MKKLTIEIKNTGLILESTSDWLMHWLTSIDRDDAVLVNATINTLIDQGDIWFISDAIINSDTGIRLILIFDSNDAVTRWETVKHIFEEMYTIAGEEPNIIVETITFEEFAKFASTNQETKFAGLPEDF